MASHSYQLDFENLQKRLDALKAELLQEEAELKKIKIKGSLLKISKYSDEKNQKNIEA